MVKGPTSTPIAPNREIPPKTENKIKNGGKFILLPNIYGFKKLSTIPTTATAHIKSPKAPAMFPERNRNIMAGIATSPVPTVGTKAAIIVTKPQSAGFGTPKKERAIPISIP